MPLLENSGELDDAERAYRRSIELTPAYATAHQWLGELLMYELGRPDEALMEFQRALALDPISPIIRDQHAFRWPLPDAWKKAWPKTQG